MSDSSETQPPEGETAEPQAQPQEKPQEKPQPKLQYEVTLYPYRVLRQRAEDVSFDEDLKQLVKDMYERMFASHGVGLAAPQVGLKKRVLVLNPEGPEGPRDLDLTLINPKIVERSGPITTFEEGCLSFPGIYAEVSRPERCRVEAFDVEGNEIKAEYEGFVSRIIQHEYDHLEGVLLVDRMSPADRMKNKDALEELKDLYRAAKKRREAARAAK